MILKRHLSISLLINMSHGNDEYFSFWSREFKFKTSIDDVNQASVGSIFCGFVCILC